MSTPATAAGAQPAATDPALAAIADYVCATPPASPAALATARLCLFDALACALLALDAPECRRLLGPLAGPPLAGSPPAGSAAAADNTRDPATSAAAPRSGGGGARVPGTDLDLDPVTAAFDIGAAIRWLDYNDTWLAAEWGHPSDNLGALLAVADYRGRVLQRPLTVGDLLGAMVQAYEVQGVLALENSFNRLGFDHVLLVRIASAAVAARLLGGGRETVVTAVSHAFLDGAALRTYRHGPTTGSRKSWAAGDATSRGVWLALLALRGEMGYPQALSAPRWGFHDVVMGGEQVQLSRPFASYVMDNILFKVAFPAEFHAQTAVECAFTLHPQVAERLDQVHSVTIWTQESALRIIDKTGPLTSPADRDHCLQYMVAVGLRFGELRAEHYREETAADPRIDELRGRMQVVEEAGYSRDYLDPAKRSIANALQVTFADGSSTERVEVEYPLGHPRRRAEARPLLRAKLERGAAARLTTSQAAQVLELWDAGDRLDALSVGELLDLLAG